MRQTRTAISALVVVSLLGSVLLAQQFQLRTRVDLVVVPFTVKDSNGELISGLDQDDFEVLEDGQVEEIQQFSIDPIPLSAVVLVDIGLAAKSLLSIQASIPALVAAFSPMDEVAIYKFDNRVQMVQDFESDLEAVRLAMDQLRKLQPTIETVGGRLEQPSPSINGRSVITTARTPISRDKRVLHDAVYIASLALRQRPAEKRKVILLVSDGNAQESTHNFNDNLLQMIDYDIQAYTIGVKPNWYSRINSVLDNYAIWTGGDYIHAGSDEDLERAYAKLTEQARNQYVLGYVSNNQPSPTKLVFRRIEVLCDKPYQIVHKRGYYQVP